MPQTKKKPTEKSSQLWTQKYVPKTVKEVIGNQNSIRDIMNWLNDWEDVVLYGKKKEVRLNPSRHGISNANARACLVSGPPGIGKTMSIRVIAEEMGYDVVEQNASDVRNKEAMQNLLEGLVDSTLVRYKGQHKKFLILMDEVDGMSASDRGGTQVLANMLKKTKVPIVCVCNDRQHVKVRSLANYCYDIRFLKPTKKAIVDRLMKIMIKEGIEADMASLEYLCENFNHDIRHILNYLQAYSRISDTLTYEDAVGRMDMTRKDELVTLNCFDAAKKLMTCHNISFRDKLDLFFVDHELIPMVVQENYLPSNPDASVEILENIAKAADMISTGDIIKSKIQSTSTWELMPNMGFASTIYPSEIVKPMVAFPKFPEWLGKNATSKKKQREARELRIMMSPVITGGDLSVALDYSPALVRLINYNLQGEPQDDVKTVIRILKYYYLDVDTIREQLPDLQLSTSSLRDPLEGIKAQTKALLTRTYNSLYKTSIKTKKPSRIADEPEECQVPGPEDVDEQRQKQDLGAEKLVDYSRGVGFSKKGNEFSEKKREYNVEERVTSSKVVGLRPEAKEKLPQARKQLIGEEKPAIDREEEKEQKDHSNIKHSRIEPKKENKANDLLGMVDSKISIGLDTLKDLVSSMIDQKLPEIAQYTQNQMEEQRSSVNQNIFENNQSLPNIKTIHYEIRCAKCGMFPIIGIRYKCSICPSFDYCEKCEDAYTHPHDFIKMRHNEPIDSSKFMRLEERNKSTHASELLEEPENIRSEPGKSDINHIIENTKKL